MNRDYLIALLAAIAVMTPGALLLALGAPPSPALVVTAGAAVAAVVSLNRRWYRRVIRRIDTQTTHLRSVIGFAAASGDIPVFWSEHAIAPETLALIQHMIAALNMGRVLELGSGLSTVLLANSFRRAGEGRILSYDDDARWAALTQAAVEREGLAAIAEVRVAPMVDVTAGGRNAAWYDLSKLDAAERFDLIVVDGPPSWKGDSHARLPALYRLEKHLAENGVLVLDDAARPGERSIAEQWQRDFPALHFRMVDIGRGLFVASRGRAALDLLPN
jgi:predicted O-methyltransferase YrrM